MKFVDRKSELRTIKETLGKSVVLLYGRRRVGKTALVREALRGSKGIYYQAVKLPPNLLYREIAGVIGNAINDEVLKSGQITDFSLILNIFAQKADGWTLVLDEFGYKLEVDPSVASIIQRFIDENRGKVGLILTGSTYTLMESLISEKSPLWGRIDKVIEVKPLSFLYTREYWDNLDFYFRAALYGALGGIPYNWERVKFGRDLFDTLYQTFFSTDAPLYDEVMNLLRGELKEPKNYMAVLQAIASGRRRFSEISDVSGIPPKSLMKYLSVFRELRFLKHEFPAGSKISVRGGLWRIRDHLLNFWFRFVFPNRHLIELEISRGMVKKLKSHWNDFMGEVYEEIVYQVVTKMISEGKLPVVDEIGRWWGKDRTGNLTEIDILGLRNREVVLAVETKWGNFTRWNFEKFKKKVDALPFEKAPNLKFVLASGRGFSFKLPKDVIALKGESILNV